MERTDRLGTLEFPEQRSGGTVSKSDLGTRSSQERLRIRAEDRHRCRCLAIRHRVRPGQRLAGERRDPKLPGRAKEQSPTIWGDAERFLDLDAGTGVDGNPQGFASIRGPDAKRLPARLAKLAPAECSIP